jgi:hypothetical protein
MFPKRSSNVLKKFIKRTENVHQTFSIKTLSNHSQNVHYTLAFPLWFQPLVIPVLNHVLAEGYQTIAVEGGTLPMASEGPDG